MYNIFQSQLTSNITTLYVQCTCNLLVIINDRNLDFEIFLINIIND